MTYDAEVVDLFAGPGGWSEACKALNLDEIGIESDFAACATRAAAGHRTVHTDLSTLDPADFTCRGFIASPPCQAFSSAGKGKGRDLIPDLIDAIHRRDWSARPDPDPKVWLVLEVGRWVDVLRPEWVALEQVPGVLPLWRAYAGWLRDIGYSVWTGVLCAADFGVPQTRERAILIASRVRPVQPPEPTHDVAPEPGLFGTLERWVSMAEALGWGHHTPGAQSQNAIRLSVADALILQSFRPDYPIQGTKTKQFEQIGNAIPPRMAEAILRTVVNRPHR